MLVVEEKGKGKPKQTTVNNNKNARKKNEMKSFENFNTRMIRLPKGFMYKK